MICNNCGNNNEGKYCNQCGQKLGIGKITMHDLWHDAWHGITHTDKGVLRLLKDLTIHPRAVYENYFKGKRKTYFSPVIFFLLSAGLLAVLYPYVFDYEDYVIKKYNEYGRTLFHLTKFRALVLLPFQIILTWLFYRKKFNLGEIIIFWLFTMGWIHAFRILFLPLYFPLIDYKSEIDNTFTILSFLMMIWQGLMLMKKISWKDVLIWIFIVNTVYLADFFFQVYLIFGFDVFSLNKFGWTTIWDIILSRYTW
jgi:hypothetical protein